MPRRGYPKYLTDLGNYELVDENISEDGRLYTEEFLKDFPIKHFFLKRGKGNWELWVHKDDRDEFESIHPQVMRGWEKW